MSEKPNWKRARKKPLIIDFREAKSPEGEYIKTIEGDNLYVDSDRSFIGRGIKGELYPINKKIFSESYDILEESAPESIARGRELLKIISEHPEVITIKTEGEGAPETSTFHRSTLTQPSGVENERRKCADPIIDYDREADVLYVNFHDTQLAADDTKRKGCILLRYKDKELIGITIIDYKKLMK